MRARIGSCRRDDTCTFVQCPPCACPSILGSLSSPTKRKRGTARMAFLIVLAALCFLMLAAYRGHSVILFAPIFTGLFMDKMVGFLKLYFPVFMLGALFGKLIELSGFSRSIVAATI